MLSLASLLNPAPSGAPPTPRIRPSPALSSPATSYSDDCSSSMFERLPYFSSKPHPLPLQHQQQHRMAKDSGGGFAKSKAKGSVNFPPFENLDEAALREINVYQIYPFGKIQEYCRHIPYNSGKKDFYEKTGRESFEVFQYMFKVPGDESDYTVMWDYNVGLVRMTPFFKCCKYSKTMPAKMLNQNPGLREITHSITGGSIMAQGYWMPYACAKAVCATFCYQIAGALIPIFGPDFPSMCTSPEAPDYGRMAIDPSLVIESTREAEMFRRVYSNANASNHNSHAYAQHIHHHHVHGPALPSPTSIPSPRLARRGLHGGGHRYGSPQEFERDRERVDYRMRFKRTINSPYGTDTDGEAHSGPELGSTHSHHMGSRMPYSPVSPPRSAGGGLPSSGWTAANVPSPNIHHAHSHSQPHPSATSNSYHTFRNEPPYNHPNGASPWLSAIPRFSGRFDAPPRLPLPQTSSWNAGPTTKRPADMVDADYEYDAGESSQSESSPTTTLQSTREDDNDQQHQRAGVNGAEKNAALLLMNLSVRDKVGKEERSEDGSEKTIRVRLGDAEVPPMASPISDGHRSKRRRATSM